MASKGSKKSGAGGGAKKKASKKKKSARASAPRTKAKTKGQRAITAGKAPRPTQKARGAKAKASKAKVAKPAGKTASAQRRAAATPRPRVKHPGGSTRLPAARRSTPRRERAPRSPGLEGAAVPALGLDVKAEALLVKVYQYAAKELSRLEEERRVEGGPDAERAEQYARARKSLMDSLRKWEDGHPGEMLSGPAPDERKDR